MAERAFIPVRVAVLTVSDTRGPAEDRSGDVLAERLAAAGHVLADRAIERRGASLAYYVLICGMILVGIVMPFSEAPWKIINAALAAIVIAEAVHHGFVLLSYRRGWHG